MVRGLRRSLDEVGLLLARNRAVHGSRMAVVIRAGAGVRYAAVDAVNRKALDSGIYRVMHATESRFKPKR